MSLDKIYRLVMALLFIPLSFLFYNYVYLVVGSFSEIRVIYLQIPTLLSYLGFFLAFYLLLMWTQPRGKHRLALVRSSFIVPTLFGGLSLILYASYFGAGLLNDIAPHGVGYPFDGLIVALVSLGLGILGLTFEKKILALPLSDDARSYQPSSRYGVQVLYSAVYTFLTMYFLAGVFNMPAYARITPETAFPLLVSLFLILSLYASLFLLIPSWDYQKRQQAGFVHLGINVLLLILTIVSFVLYPNGLIDGYPAFIPLELMGSLNLFPYVMPALLFLNSLGYFLFYAKDPDKPSKLGQWLMNNRLDDWWEKHTQKKKQK